MDAINRSLHCVEVALPVTRKGGLRPFRRDRQVLAPERSTKGRLSTAPHSFQWIASWALGRAEIYGKWELGSRCKS